MNENTGAWSKSGAFVLGDGAMGTELQIAGLPLGEAPESWNLVRPESVRRIHAAYAEAGASWVRTNTFGGSTLRLAATGLGDRVGTVNAAAVRAARDGAPGAIVLGSMGPIGSSPESAEAAFAIHVEHLCTADVDGILVETAVSLREALAAVRASRNAGAAIIWASFTPDADGNLLDGTRPEMAAEAFLKAGATAVGANCGTGPDSIARAIRRLVASDIGPIVAIPSAGLPTIFEGRAAYSLTPGEFAQTAIQFRDAGVRFFGGCCGTGPQHIRAAAKAIGRLAPIM